MFIFSFLRGDRKVNRTGGVLTRWNNRWRRMRGRTPSVIRFSQLHVYWDKDRSPTWRQNRILSIARLSSACKRTECQLNAVTQQWGRGSCHQLLYFYYQSTRWRHEAAVKWRAAQQHDPWTTVSIHWHTQGLRSTELMWHSLCVDSVPVENHWIKQATADYYTHNNWAKTYFTSQLHYHNIQSFHSHWKFKYRKRLYSCHWCLLSLSIHSSSAPSNKEIFSLWSWKLNISVCKMLIEQLLPF